MRLPLVTELVRPVMGPLDLSELPHGPLSYTNLTASWPPVHSLALFWHSGHFFFPDSAMGFEFQQYRVSSFKLKAENLLNHNFSESEHNSELWFPSCSLGHRGFIFSREVQQICWSGHHRSYQLQGVHNFHLRCEAGWLAVALVKSRSWVRVFVERDMRQCPVSFPVLGCARRRSHPINK